MFQIAFGRFLITMRRVQWKRSRWRWHVAGPNTAAGLMLALWLAAFALSSSPALHQLLHQDSASDEHECLVTCLAKSQVLSGGATGLVLMVALVCFAVRSLVILPFVAQPENRLAPSRAPPALISFRKG